jgi:predicted negative regulator of RcsB-dependent stress response/thioredoxin-like negative regulator of GroEL
MNPLLAAESPIEPQKMIIPTFFRETILLPKLPEHQYILHTPQHVAEPYRPDFVNNFIPLTDDYPQNIQPGWLARLSPGLAGFFSGSQGKLEGAILQYEHRQFAAAERAFRSLIRGPVRISEPARLALAWIQYQHGDFDEALELLPPLLHATTDRIGTEARYLSVLIRLQQNRFKAILTLTEPTEGQSVAELDIRLFSARLYALLQLSQWMEIDRLLEARPTGTDRYTRHYRFILETAGISAFYQHDYQTGLDYFRQADALHAAPRYRADIGRKISWTAYFIGRYAEALDTIEGLPPIPDERYTAELRYLKAISLLQLNDWERLNTELQRLRDEPFFSSLLAYQIQIAVDDPMRLNDLIGQIDRQPLSNPEMRFYSALFSANQAFDAGRHAEARDRLLSAMAVDIDNDDYQVAQYHLALAYLKLGAYSQAITELLQLDQPSTNDPIRQHLHYHLAFAYYRSDLPEDCLHHLAAIKFETSPALQKELMLMQAGALLKMNRHPAATQILVELWQTQNLLVALEDAIRILFHDGRFLDGLALLDANPEANSPLLLHYRIRLLLGLGKAQEAEKLIGNLQQNDDRLIALQISVWEATQQWERIINRLTAILKEPLTSELQQQYHISLGDAYYNLKQYRHSKSQYYRAMLMTANPELKSQIAYNIALASYYEGDNPTFLKEAQLILNDPEITPEIHYQMSLLLADFYFESGNHLDADRTLKAYLTKHNENAANINLKRMRFFFQTGAYSACLALGANASASESHFQRRDRIITTAYCAEPAQRLHSLVSYLEDEVRQPQTPYRETELQFLLANAYLENRQYEPALDIASRLKVEELSAHTQKKNQLLLAKSYLGLMQTADARSSLGDIRRYYQTDLYTEYLKTAAEIDLAEGHYNAGLRRLLRIVFLPTSNDDKRDEARLRIVETYIMSGDIMMARKQLSDFESERLENTSTNARERFLDLQQKLAEQPTAFLSN